ncbi:uncharacterized protein [Porites lutea]|uniref:uncharacterized protein n=1 Tax=Porites lutea TaxID=51062 RepID=UPI003CC51DD3
MKTQFLLANLLLGYVVLAFGIEIKYMKYCGPKDKTVQFSFKPVITPGQFMHINVTFTPQVDVYYSSYKLKFTREDNKVSFKGAGVLCDDYPKLCMLPAGETASLSFNKRLNFQIYSMKGTFKLRAELYNQDLVMWMCFELKFQVP